MYVLLMAGVPLGFAVNAAAHAGCAAALKWRDDNDFIEWARQSFRKVTCKINHQQLTTVMDIFGEDELCVITESDLDDQIVAVALKPRPKRRWPSEAQLHTLPLYG